MFTGNPFIEEIQGWGMALLASFGVNPGEPPKEYLYGDKESARSSYFLSHTGNCEDLGFNTSGLDLNVAWNDAKQRIDAHITEYQDFRNREILPVPEAFGCIRKDTTYGAEFMLTPGYLTREFYEEEFGAPVMNEIEKQTLSIARDRKMALDF